MKYACATQVKIYDLFVLVVLKMVSSFVMWLWNRRGSRPGHLPEGSHPFVEMEALMGKVCFFSSPRK